MKPVRIGIFAIIAFAVLSHGAVEPWARGILEAASGILLLIWAVPFLLAEKECPIVLPALLFPLLALALLATAQLAFRLTTSPFTTRIELQLMLSMLDSLLPGRAGLPHAGRLAQLRVVRDNFCIFCCRSGNLAAFDVQRKTLLVSRIEIPRHPVWALREPQSLCRICRIGFADVTGTFAFGPRTP